MQAIQNKAQAATPAERLQAARKAALEGVYSLAAELSREVLTEHPHALLALRLLAWSEMELEEGTPEETFRACLEVDAEDAVAEVGLALTAERRKDDAEARLHLLRAYELDPTLEGLADQLRRLGADLPDGPLVDGMRKLRAGDLGAAATAFRMAAVMHRPDLAARLALATAIWPLGGRDQVENICSDVLTTHPNCLKALLYLLALAVERRRTLQVRELLQRVMDVDPGLLLSRDILDRIGMAERVFGR